MRTLVVSDLHLGNGGLYDTFAGGSALPQLIGWFAASPGRILVNGDAADFLLNEDPLVIDVETATAQARAIVAAPESAAVLRALGDALASGCEVVFRLGNHDVELALSEVQAVFRAALGQPAEVAARLQFQPGTEPAILEVGGARVLLTHGEHRDPWNRVDYRRLLAPPDERRRFVYPPGSKLVKTILNPLKREYGMRFSDLLKPDFTGAVMTALAVDPTAVKEIFQGSTLSLLAQLMSRIGGPMTFAEGEEDTGLGERVAELGLSDDELGALEALAGEGGLMSFSSPEAESGLRRKLLKGGLSVYAAAHKAIAGGSGDSFFAFAPSDAEWKEARRLAEKFDVNAVVLGHSHAARFRAEPELTYLNTGTWIGLMRLPDADAPDAEWEDFLRMLQRNPGMDPAKGPVPPMATRFTAALIEPGATGATLGLLEWRDGQAHVLVSGAVAAR